MTLIRRVLVIAVAALLGSAAFAGTAQATSETGGGDRQALWRVESAPTDIGVQQTIDGCTASSGHIHRITYLPTGQQFDLGDGYSNTGGGYNCAWLNKIGGTRGTETNMGIRMAKCTGSGYAGDSSCPISGTWDPDRGNFAYYAGRVEQTGTNGRCIWIQVTYLNTAWATPIPIHRCG